MTRWKIAQAKARFSEVLSLSQKEPQVICHRDKEVGVLIPFSSYQVFLESGREQAGPTIRELLKELQEINKKEPVSLSFPKRKNRRVPGAGWFS